VKKNALEGNISRPNGHGDEKSQAIKEVATNSHDKNLNN
jgi:hypothetical protein